jgi:hypothetical protein
MTHVTRAPRAQQQLRISAEGGGDRNCERNVSFTELKKNQGPNTVKEVGRNFVLRHTGLPDVDYPLHDGQMSDLLDPSVEARKINHL